MNMNQKSFTKIATVVLIVIFAGVVGYFALVKKIIPVAQQTPAPQDETTNWKTYRNEAYGIEFQYPREWFFETNFDDKLSFEQNQNRASLNSKITNYSLKLLPIKDNLYVVPKNFFSVGFDVIDRRFATQKNSYITTIKNIEERYRGDDPCLFSYEKIIGLKSVRVLKSKPSCEETNEIIWFDGNRIVIFNSTEFHDSGQRDIYYQIISTFKFIK